MVQRSRWECALSYRVQLKPTLTGRTGMAGVVNSDATPAHSWCRPLLPGAERSVTAHTRSAPELHDGILRVSRIATGPMATHRRTACCGSCATTATWEFHCDDLQSCSGRPPAPAPPPVRQRHSPALIFWCGSTARITCGWLAFIAGTSLRRQRLERRGGQRYFERGNPLSSHSPQAASEGIAGHSRTTTESRMGSRFASDPSDTSPDPGPSPT